MRKKRDCESDKKHIENRGKKRKIKKEKKVRADFLKDFSKARGAESWVRRVPPPTRRTYRLVGDRGLEPRTSRSQTERSTN